MHSESVPQSYFLAMWFRAADEGRPMHRRICNEDVKKCSCARARIYNLSPPRHGPLVAFILLSTPAVCPVRGERRAYCDPMVLAMSAPRVCRLTAAFGNTTALRAAVPRVQGRRARQVTRMGVRPAEHELRSSAPCLLLCICFAVAAPFKMHHQRVLRCSSTCIGSWESPVAWPCKPEAGAPPMYL